MNITKPLLFLLFSTQFLFGQKATTLDFPDSYYGVYIGELIINSENNIKNYPMEFHLLPTDSIGIYKYMIVYGKDKNRQERKYTLKEVNKEKGNYILDENNGIILDCIVVTNKMYFLFEVMDNLLTTFVTFNKDHLIFEIVVTNTKNKKISGGENEDIPEVISYPISVVQKAILIKQ